MSYKNKTTGEIISDQEYQSKFGSQISAPEIPSTEISQPSEGGFLQRLKLSFGGSKAREQIKQIEEEQGTRGTFDTGDIADVAGTALPLAGGIAGAAFGPVGSAVGTAAGQGIRRIFGGLIGADQPTSGDIAKDIAITAGATYIGGKIISKVGKPVFNYLTEKLPKRIAIDVIDQSKKELLAGKDVSEFLLKRARVGSYESLIRSSKDAITTLGVQIRTVLKEISTKTNITQDSIAKETVRRLNAVGGSITSKEVAGAVNNLAPQAKGLLQQTEWDVNTANYLRDLLDDTLGDKGFLVSQLPFNKTILRTFSDVLRESVKMSAPETKKLFAEQAKEIILRNALLDKSITGARQQIITAWDLAASVLGGYGLGPAGAVAGFFARRAIKSPTVLLGGARVLKQAGRQGIRQVLKTGAPPMTGIGIPKLFDRRIGSE